MTNLIFHAIIFTRPFSYVYCFFASKKVHYSLHLFYQYY
uniref:Uncharacterized protein n=1 Tax=Porphyridium purpureum TaxID=35688 RepID=W0RZD2_PORPP|nr:hypothetical protein Y721_p011 [Porphyridium purpureum]BAO23797.1 hypothetical protein [Porphyridium purpureum]